jgi:hypothetical protein
MQSKIAMLATLQSTATPPPGLAARRHRLNVRELFCGEMIDLPDWLARHRRRKKGVQPIGLTRPGLGIMMIPSRSRPGQADSKLSALAGAYLRGLQQAAMPQRGCCATKSWEHGGGRL